MENMEISIEIYTENKKQLIFISHSGSSGCVYPVTNASDVGYCVTKYLESQV